MTWYIAQDGKTKEMPEEVLVYKIKNREIAGDAWVVNEEIKNWTALKDTQLYKQYAPVDSAEPVGANDPGRTDTDHSRGSEVDEQSVAAFVGKNQSYYVMKWKMMRATSNKVSWNWSSFLFNTYWMLYRKMYIPAMIKLLIDWTLNYMGTVGSVISLGLWIVCGLFGNYLYFQNMEQRIVEADVLGYTEKTYYLHQKGGTTLAPVAIVGVLYLALYVVMFVGLAALYSYLPK